MRETKVIDGEEHYQLGITEEWVPTHPVPDLHRGLKFYSTSAMSPVFIVEGNDPEELKRHPTMIPGGIPDRDEKGEWWLLYVPSSGSEPLRWRRGENIREQFQCGQYRLEPVRMAKDRGIDSEAWWQPIIEDDMTDYDFIDPDLPEERAEDNDEEPEELDLEDYPELRHRTFAVSPNRDIEAELEGADIDAEEIVEELEDDVDSDKVAGENSIVNRLKAAIGGFLQ